MTKTTTANLIKTLIAFVVSLLIATGIGVLTLFFGVDFLAPKSPEDVTMFDGIAVIVFVFLITAVAFVFVFLITMVKIFRKKEMK